MNIIGAKYVAEHVTILPQIQTFTTELTLLHPCDDTKYASLFLGKKVDRSSVVDRRGMSNYAPD